MTELTRKKILAEAWKTLAANQFLYKGGEEFPRGFWPDLAAVAVEMALQQTFDPVLDFRPTRSGDIGLQMGNKVPDRYLSKMKAEYEALVAGEKEADEDNPFAKVKRARLEAKLRKS